MPKLQPPDYELWKLFPLDLRLSIALHVFWCRLPHYLLEKQSFALGAFICTFLTVYHNIPSHPLKLIVSLGSATSSAVLVMIPIRIPFQSKAHWL